jgi:hypothetical protein
MPLLQIGTRSVSGTSLFYQRIEENFIEEKSSLHPELFFSDLNNTFQLISDPAPDLDPVSDPT